MIDQPFVTESPSICKSLCCKRSKQLWKDYLLLIQFCSRQLAFSATAGLLVLGHWYYAADVVGT